jgi:phosphoribosylanthranilate isomerase
MEAPALKVCGLTRREDAESAARSGALYLGAVFAAESPRFVPAEHAVRLFSGLEPSRVGVFVDAAVAEVVRTATSVELDVVQLHGDEDEAMIAGIRSAGNWSIWKAVRVRTGEDIDRAVDRFGASVDGFLVDRWSPRARGGTGESFDWEVAVEARDRVPSGLTFVLAGGIRAENVARAVVLLRPDAVDVSSGVESAVGVKDPTAIDALIHALRGVPR